MNIHTPRLTLRPMSRADLDTTFAYAGSPENTEFMLFLPYAAKAEAEAELVKMEEKMSRTPCRDYFFAIELDGAHIGEISLELTEDETEAELGWILHRDHWGKGYMTECALAIRDFAASLPRLCLLYAHCDSRNRGSAAVMEHMGMTLAETGTRTNRNSGEVSGEYKYILHLKK
ncbi:MAG: GNAT family N-acetyltransferase [Ruminococcaceae bacterium]|nr:GNAT family N-acetyltransferase [Oscillospiraceae bacterium]